MTMTPLRRRGAALAATLLSATLVLTACGNDGDDSGGGAASGETRSFEADNGTIEIPVDPQRIIGIQRGASNLLEYGIAPVGLGQFNEDPDWLSPEKRALYDEAPQVADWETIDYEEMASLQPDLIVISNPDFAWEEMDNDRLQSIAPTVYIQTNIENWKVQEERIADAIGRTDEFNERKAEYDGLIEDLGTKYADLLDSETMVSINRYGGTEDGVFSIEEPNFYCTTFATELGVQLAEADDSEESGDTSISIEQIGDLAQYDVILYPEDPAGGPKEELLPVLESNSWGALPQVSSGRALSVTCTGGLSYPDGITYLESLDEALGTLPAE